MQRPKKRFWKACTALYGEGSTFVAGKKKSPPKSPIASERQEQIMLFAWLRKSKIPAFAIPNGGSRHPLEAINLKRAGVEPGVPDLMIPIMRNGYGGLFIELKRTDGGKLSENQERWRDILKAQGYLWIEAHGANEAILSVKNYLS